MTSRTASLALASVALAAACHRGSARGGALKPEPRVSTDSVVLRVTNRADRALAIAVSRDGRETTLGGVDSAGVARFTVRARDVNSGRVALVATANRQSMRTVPFRVRGGQVVWFEINPGLVGSRVFVRWPEEGPPRQ